MPGNKDGLQPWKTLSTDCILDVSPWFSVLRDKIELPSGRVIDDYYRIAAPDYAIVCALQDDGSVLMERHYKQCLGRFLLTAPAGGIETGEAPLATAQRELLEETGHCADNWTSLGAFTVDGTRGICRSHLFLARQIEKVAEPLADDMEDFRIAFLCKDQIANAIKDGTICLLPDIALLSMVFSPFSGLDGTAR